MDRALRLTAFWNWLPAFRAVAETEHLPTAAALLHVSPSALSRTVRQLEAALGERLFERAHRAMRLTAAGREVLVAVRDAMRGLDDRLGQVGTSVANRAPVRIGGAAAWLPVLVVPAVLDCCVVQHAEVPAAAAPALLHRGELDLWIGAAPASTERLVVERLGLVGNGVVGRPSARPLTERSFAVWTGGDDGWPVERARQVVVRSPSLAAVLEACVGTDLVAAAPRVLAKARGLRQASRMSLASTPLHLLRRPPLGPGPLDEVAARITAAAARALA
ncbi:MAG: LysR family transcriptional regulator [Kofleriaceae bacterium]